MYGHSFRLAFMYLQQRAKYFSGVCLLGGELIKSSFSCEVDSFDCEISPFALDTIGLMLPV